MKTLTAVVLFASLIHADGLYFFKGKQVSKKPASGTYYTTKYAQDHGGYNDNLNFGANAGDIFEIIVDCDHTDPEGYCFYRAANTGPWLVRCQGGIGSPCDLANKVAFTLDQSTFLPGHQRYTATATQMGNLFVSTSYYWIGTNVHYHTKVTAKEVIQ